VHGFETDEVTGGAGAEFYLYTWTVGPGQASGSLDVNSSLANATAGENGSVSVTWSGIDPKTHLGTITHDDGQSGAGLLPLEITLIEIEN
jgi:hypothetical protein